MALFSLQLISDFFLVSIETIQDFLHEFNILKTTSQQYIYMISDKRAVVLSRVLQP